MKVVDGVRICQTGGKVPPRALRYSFPWTLGGSLRDVENLDLTLV